MKKRYEWLIICCIVFYAFGYAHCHLAVRNKLQTLKEMRLDLVFLNTHVSELTEQVAQLANKFERIDNVLLTAYSNDHNSINVPLFRDGKTATGTKARWGVVAADPKKFPYGTRLLIEGFPHTIFVVEDTGIAMRRNTGNHLDIFFNSEYEAICFGRKRKNVIKLI